MHSLWAVARNTIIQLLRRRAPLAAALIAAVTLPILSLYIFEADNTLIGKVKMVLTYNTTLMSVIMMLYVLYFSSFLLSDEILKKSIMILDVKPVQRWKIMIGKWLGVALVSAWMLLLMGVITYGITLGAIHIAVSAPDTPFHTQLSETNSQLLVSRNSFRPTPPDVKKEMKRLKRDLRNEGKVDVDKLSQKDLNKELAKIIDKSLLGIPYTVQRDFNFEGLPHASTYSNEMTIRYKFYGTRGTGNASELQALWKIEGEGIVLPYALRTISKRAKFRTFNMPSHVIGKDGKLNITIKNITGPEKGQPAAKIIVPISDGIEILVPSSSFEANFVRGMLLLWIRLLMIAAIGISANAFLSGRVTAFLLIGILITGSLNSFVYKSFAPQKTAFMALKQTPIAKAKRSFSKFIAAMPNFDSTDPLPDFLVGREISWYRLLWRFIADVCIRGGFFIFFGIIAFYRKEVGLPTY